MDHAEPVGRRRPAAGECGPDWRSVPAIGAGLTTLGAAKGIGTWRANAVESHRPATGGWRRVFTSMIIAAALIEGFTFFALVICNGVVGEISKAGGPAARGSRISRWPCGFRGEKRPFLPVGGRLTADSTRYRSEAQRLLKASDLCEANLRLGLGSWVCGPQSCGRRP